MNKPEKKEGSRFIRDGYDAHIGHYKQNREEVAYNQACEDHDEWLKEVASVENIERVIKDKLAYFVTHVDKNGVVKWKDGTVSKYIGLTSISKDLAQTTHNLFNKER